MYVKGVNDDITINNCRDSSKKKTEEYMNFSLSHVLDGTLYPFMISLGWNIIS